MIRDWSTIKNFSRSEWVNDPDKILWETVLLLDEMRATVARPIHIHVAWDASGHVEDSSHYGTEATAVDFHIEGLPLLDQWLFAERYPWHGLGVYPFWRNPGLHVDLRPQGRDHPNLGNRWWRDGRGSYQPLDRRLIRTILTLPPYEA